MPKFQFKQLACFLPFNKTVTEDLTGNIEVEIMGGNDGEDYWGDNHHLGLRKSIYVENDKTLYLQNLNYSIGIYNCLKLKNSENWNFDNQDFTIQCWYKPIGFMTYVPGNVSHYDSLFASETDGYLGINNAENGIRYHIINAAHNDWHTPWQSNIKLINNKWYHVAMCRKGTVVYGFLNGVKNYQSDIGTAVINRPREPFYIGRWGSNAFGGEFCMAEFMVDIGHCWYTDNFTPRTFLNRDIVNNFILSSNANT